MQVATGDVNPLRYQRLVDRVREWFTEHPLYDEHGQPIVVPDWNFPGRGRVEAQLDRATFVLRATERIVAAVPVRGRAAEWGASDRGTPGAARPGPHLRRALRRLHRVRGRLRRRQPAGHERGAGRPRPRRCWRSTRPGDRLGRLHHPDPPAVGRRARPCALLARHGAADGAATERLRAQVLAPERQMAAFDLENTLIASNVVTSYSWLATRRLSTADRVRFALRTLAEAPALLAQDRADRSDFLRGVLPPLRRRTARPARRGRARALQPGAAGTLVPRGDPPCA